jgi:hypothetical protein
MQLPKPQSHKHCRQKVDSSLTAPAGSSLAPWFDPGPIAPSPFVHSPGPMGRCGCAAMSAAAMAD